MSEILHITQDDSFHQKKLDTLHLAEKYCKYTLHQELLLNYKKNKKFPKGMSLKFNPSLCNNETINKRCRKVLRNASFMLRDIMLDGITEKLRDLKSEKANFDATLKESFTTEEYHEIINYVEHNVDRLSKEIRNRHIKKQEPYHDSFDFGLCQA